MLLRKQILIFIVSVSFFGNMTIANCYFIRLNGYQLDRSLDVFSWGELSPLIALETGEYFNLSPSGQEMIDTSSQKTENLRGELYYIPQNLIYNNQFSLKMIVIERDIESTDDLVLPLSERFIPLIAKSFILDSMKFDVSFEPFGDPSASIPQHKQSYQFEIIKESQDCSLKTSEGQANDLRLRLENKLKQLHLQTIHYEKAFLTGGQEYKYYRLPRIQKSSFSDALHIAKIIASVNSSELITLGMKLEKLTHIKNFKNVWREYRYLVQDLLKDKITFQYLKEDKWTKIEVPSLRFHSNWKKWTKERAILPPKSWNIQIE
ncbi:MAG: hypothetical protein U9O24_00025 [Campylobacterota bacterium]|nr:hypothetical protein [Campylobacterota bacterium]